MSTPPRGEGWRPGDPHGSGPPWQQGPWLHPPGPPPPTGNGLKWLLGAVAVLLVIAIAVGITVIVMSRDKDSGPSASPTGALSDVASANDTGPVAIITDEPTCKTLNGINSSLADVQANGWSAQRGDLGPAAAWNPQQRAQVQAVATAMKNASDQMIALAKETPHRVIRELYEQFIAYGRAYAESVPTYQPSDDALASSNVSIGSALLGICSAMEFGSARRSLAVESAATPYDVRDSADIDNPERFIKPNDSKCADWTKREDQFVADTTAWANLDTKLTASEWTPEQRAVQQGVLPVLTAMASDMASAGRASGNPVLEDFAILGSLYFQAYVSAGDDYTGADSWLSYSGSRLSNSIASACRASAS